MDGNVHSLQESPQKDNYSFQRVKRVALWGKNDTTFTKLMSPVMEEIDIVGLLRSFTKQNPMYFCVFLPEVIT